MAFCAWLTQRSSDFWQYRFPRYEEWQQIGKALLEDVGCWLEKDPLFLWLNGAPSHPLRDK